MQGPTPSTTLVEFAIDALLAGEKILLLGEAGQGKTIILKQVFRLLADRFLDKPDRSLPLPLYIPLRELPSLAGSAVEVLWAYVGEDFPLPFEDFAALVRQHRIVLLFDGFDEMPGELTQRAINERAAGKVFACPSLLSCRKSFFEFYLSMSALQERYPHWIELQPLEFTPALTYYIERVCQKKQAAAPP